MTHRNMEWLGRSECGNLDGDIFFLKPQRKPSGDQTPEETKAQHRVDKFLVDQAKAACERCPVREECFWEEMLAAQPDRHSIRAGLTPGQRLQLRHDHKKEIAARKALLSRVA